MSDDAAPVPVDAVVELTPDNVTQSLVARILDGSPEESQEVVDRLGEIVEQRRRRR